ncbi:MAG: DoxX protein [Cyanobacteria bacterium P01_F01_bin.3]
MIDTQKLKLSLAIVRITLALFFLVWSVEKIVAPELAKGVFSAFYPATPSTSISVVLGILQTAIVLLFLGGLFKLWTYGALLGMHLVSTLVSYKPLLDPYTPPNHLFWAAVPTLGALIALFILREEDQFLTFSRARNVRNKIDAM